MMLRGAAAGKKRDGDSGRPFARGCGGCGAGIRGTAMDRRGGSVRSLVTIGSSSASSVRSL